jgi:ABC-type transport system substrate-binding protein
MQRSPLGIITLTVVLLITACTSPAAPATPSRPAAAPSAATTGSTDGSAAAPTPRATPGKVLTVVIRNEPTDLFGLGPSGMTAAATEVKPIFHDPLARRDDKGQLHAALATDIPSVERGTWRVLPDGGMEMTWKLRPNVTWQDGAPLTSADVAFAFGVRKDSEAARSGNGPGHVEQIQSVETPDPQTAVVRWSSAYYDGAESSALEPLPKHLLDGLDRAALASSPLLQKDAIGAGPYKLVEWERGSRMTFARFDNYFRGRPPLDQVTVRFIADPNAQIESITDGTADVVIPAGIDAASIPDLRNRWVGTGNETFLGLTGRLNVLEAQLRPDVARPRNGFTNLQVRQGFYHALDRQTLAEGQTNKIAPAADSWIRPDSALRKELENSIPQYPFDVFHAGRLIEFAGWTRDAEGSLANTQTGEPFALEVWGRPGTEKLANAVAEAWTATGARASVTMVPPERANDGQYEAQRPGVLLSQVPDRLIWERHLHSRDVATPANNWSGTNRSGFSKPGVDDIVERLTGTIDPGGQIAYQRQLLFDVMGELPIMPLYWDVAPALVRKGVKALIVPGANTTGNIAEWDKDPS